MSHQHAVLAPSAGRIQHRTQDTDTRLELLVPLLFQRDGLSLKRWVSTVQERRLGQASSSPAPSHRDEFVSWERRQAMQVVSLCRVRFPSVSTSLNQKI